MERDAAMQLAELEATLASHAADIGRLRGANAKLRQESTEDRAAVRALINALPKCAGAIGESCRRVATRRASGGELLRFCDEHADIDLRYAEPLRALLARIAAWGGAS